MWADRGWLGWNIPPVSKQKPRELSYSPSGCGLEGREEGVETEGCWRSNIKNSVTRSQSKFSIKLQLTHKDVVCTFFHERITCLGSSLEDKTEISNSIYQRLDWAVKSPE